MSVRRIHISVNIQLAWNGSRMRIVRKFRPTIPLSRSSSRLSKSQPVTGSVGFRRTQRYRLADRASGTRLPSILDLEILPRRINRMSVSLCAILSIARRRSRSRSSTGAVEKVVKDGIGRKSEISRPCKGLFGKPVHLMLRTIGSFGDALCVTVICDILAKCRDGVPQRQY